MSVTITLPELTARWLQESLGVFTQKTLDHYRALLENHVFPYFGKSVEISQEQVQRFILEKKSQGLSESTVNVLYLVLRRILEYGASIGVCPDPSWDFSLGTARRKNETVILTPEEERRLVRYLTEKPDGKHLGLFLALTLGLGKSEILNLQWKDVSFKLDRIRVISEKGPVLNKRRKKRDIPFGEREKIYLRKMASHPDFYVTSGSGKQSSIEILRARLVKATGELILPFVVLTDLRRTYAVRSLEGGIGFPELASRLGIENNNGFRRQYYELVSPETRARLEKETLEGRKTRQAPEHLNWPEKDAELTALEAKYAARKAELKTMIDNLEGDLAIIQMLRKNDCTPGANREGLYTLVEKLIGTDKDGQFLVDYLRCNMRVEDMPQRKVTTPQAIRRHVTKAFDKLGRKIDQLNTIEGHDILEMFNTLCLRIGEIAPKAAPKRGPKPKPGLKTQYDQAMEALGRIEKNKK
jgi:integrase